MLPRVTRGVLSSALVLPFTVRATGASTTQFIAHRLNSTSAKSAADFPAAEKQVKIVPSTSVSESNLHPELKKNFLKHVGDTLTPVQHAAIDSFLESEEGIVVRAQTGTGKTFAFGLPIIHDILEDPRSKAHSLHSIVISPTRDLATQTFNSFSKLWRQASRSVPNPELVLMIGQAPAYAQIKPFKRNNKPQIVVGTPGRIKDLLSNERVIRDSSSNVRYIIIDEADELLTANFEREMEEIIDVCNSLKRDSPKIKVMMFSATMNSKVFEFAERIIGKGFPYVDVVVDNNEVNSNITQEVVQTGSVFQSYAAALSFIGKNASNPHFKAIAFFETTFAVEEFGKLVYNYLRKIGVRRFNTHTLHGKLTMGRRSKAANGFRNDNAGLLVASNVAARGMDFPNVSDVFQVGINRELSNYTHRIGRTGRAGKEGHSSLFLTTAETPLIAALEEKGNVFSEAGEYETDLEAEEYLRSAFDAYQAEELVKSVLTGTLSTSKELHVLNKNSLVQEAAQFYVDLTGSDEKLKLNGRFATNLGINNREAREYFDISGPPTSRSFNSDSRGGYNRGGNNRGGYNRGGNNRGGDYSSRGGNSRGGSSRDSYNPPRGGRGPGHNGGRGYQQHNRWTQKTSY